MLDAANAAGSVIVTFVVDVQLFASLTVIVYDPAAKAEKVVPEPKVVPSIEYVYGEVPPVPVTVTDPALAPKHTLFVGAAALTAKALAGWVIVTDNVFVVPFTSVTVTAYVPIANPEIS